MLETLAADHDFGKIFLTCRRPDSPSGLGNWGLGLIVDDDPGVQRTIRLLLKRAGRDVVVAANGPVVVSGQPIGTGLNAEPDFHAIAGKRDTIPCPPVPFRPQASFMTAARRLEAPSQSASPPDRIPDAASRA